MDEAERAGREVVGSDKARIRIGARAGSVMGGHDMATVGGFQSDPHFQRMLAHPAVCLALDVNVILTPPHISH